MSVYQNILEWSQARPDWQRDCLRRLISQDKLSAQDLDELAQICKQPHGILPPDAPTVEARPITPDHIASAAAGHAATAITSLEATQNINGLIPDQTLSFSNLGLSIVYGDNAAGKSGYVKVLKRLCRARGGGKPVKPDAFKSGPRPPASATVKYVVGSTADSAAWVDGQPGPTALSAVSVFDSSCASIYVENDTDVAFTPAGLDLFGKLAKACESMAQSLQAELNALDAQKKSFVGFTTDTEAGKIVCALSAATSAESITKLAADSKNERESLAENQRLLAELEANDPKKVAKELRLKAGRFQNLASRLKNAEKAINDAMVARLKSQQEDAVTKKKAASLASDDLFKSEPLRGIGSDEWKALWEAARSYSESHAYPGHPFPKANEASDNCVLCQQPLAPVSQTRMKGFEEFVKQAAQKAARDAGNAVGATALEIRNSVIQTAEDEAILAELESVDAGCSMAVRKFLASATSRKAAILKDFDAVNWTTPIDALPPTAAEETLSIVTNLTTKAAEQDVLDVSKEIAARKKVIAEIQARKLLSDHEKEILAEIARLQKRKRIEAAVRTTSTTGITQKSTELAGAIVTDALSTRMGAELKELGMTSLPVRLVKVGGERGNLRHKIQLVAQDGSPFAVEDVASEGEHRTIALAAFLAELATERSSSSLIFDDPVCSLDHIRRRRVADRLTREASVRQVIIFTHDITFVMLLNEAMIAQGLGDRADLQITRRGNQPGYCEEGLPWGGMTAQQRVKALKNKAQEAKTIRNKGTDNEYAVHAGHFYGCLREAWERAVEDVLFGGTIKRAAREVHTKLIRSVDVVPSDYEHVTKGMTKCSTWLAGHDEPEGMNVSWPEPDELLADAEALESWIAEITRRRDAARAKAASQSGQATNPAAAMVAKATASASATATTTN